MSGRFGQFWDQLDFSLKKQAQSLFIAIKNFILKTKTSGDPSPQKL